MLSVLRLTKISLYKHLGTINFWTPFILAIAAVSEFSRHLADMTKYYSVPVNGFSASFIFTTTNATFIIFLGVFILFSDLPFKDNQQMFLISRSGKRVWILSQVFYVIFVTLMYFAFIFIFYCASLFPNIGFSANSWGKIIRTISETDAGIKFEIRFIPSAGILSDFSPLSAFIYSFATATAIAVIIGLVVLLLNLTVKHNFGIIASGAVVFMYMFVHMGGSAVTYYFSPLNWCSIFVADKKVLLIIPTFRG